MRPHSIALCLCSLHAVALSAQTPVSEGTLLTRLGQDTLVIERFRRTRDSLTGEVLARYPTLSVGRYAMALGPDGRPSGVRIESRRPDGSVLASGIRQIDSRYGPDGAEHRILRDSVEVRRAEAQRAVPFILHSWALWEAVVDAVRREGVDSVSVPIVTPGSTAAGSTPIRVLGPAARVWNIVAFGPHELTFDGEGRLVRLDGRLSTNRILVERGPYLSDREFRSLSAAFAESEAAGRGVAPSLAPRDTVRAAIGGARVEVQYSRPRLRGRDVFRDGVLGDTIWRTGANTVTTLVTDRPLLIGGERLPPGQYALYTHVPRDNSRYTLIVNRKLGSGAPRFYDATQDLFRVPLEVRRPTESVEQMTIRLEPGREGRLRILWDRLDLSVTLREP